MKKKVWILIHNECDRGHDYVNILNAFDGEPSIPALQNALIQRRESGDVINAAIAIYRQILDSVTDPEGVTLAINDEGDFYYFEVKELE